MQKSEKMYAIYEITIIDISPSGMCEVPSSTFEKKKQSL